MKLNLKVNFKDAMGNPLVDKKGKALVSERVAVLLFNLSLLHEKPMTAEEKYLAYKLCTRIVQNPEEVEMDTSEAAFLKEVCAEAFSSGAYGQILDIIEKTE